MLLGENKFEFEFRMPTANTHWVSYDQELAIYIRTFGHDDESAGKRVNEREHFQLIFDNEI